MRHNDPSHQFRKLFESKGVGIIQPTVATNRRDDQGLK